MPLDSFKIVYTANYNMNSVTDIVSTFLRAVSRIKRWLPTRISSEKAVDIIVE